MCSFRFLFSLFFSCFYCRFLFFFLCFAAESIFLQFLWSSHKFINYPTDQWPVISFQCPKFSFLVGKKVLSDSDSITLVLMKWKACLQKSTAHFHTQMISFIWLLLSFFLIWVHGFGRFWNSAESYGFEARNFATICSSSPGHEWISQEKRLKVIKCTHLFISNQSAKFYFF